MRRTVLSVALAATALLVATGGSGHASSLAELSAAQGVQGAAASNGASAAHGALDTIKRHLSSAGHDAWASAEDPVRSHGAVSRAWASSKSSGAGKGWASQAKTSTGKGWATAGDGRHVPARR